MSDACPACSAPIVGTNAQAPSTANSLAATAIFILWLQSFQVPGDDELILKRRWQLLQKLVDSTVCKQDGISIYFMPRL